MNKSFCNLLVIEAAGLLEPGEMDLNPEYLRGMAELIARACPRADLPTPERAHEIIEAIALSLAQNKIV